MLSERPRGSASETRKITKSAMEKKRRARINTSLVELKSILAGMISHKSERFDKMEKADILEMTVTYVKQLQRKSETASPTSPTKDEDYKNGVNSCISEVIKYIASNNSCDVEIKAKLLDHLANRLSGAEPTNTQEKYNPAYSTPSATHSNAHIDVTDEATDINSNNPKVVNLNNSTESLVSPVILCQDNHLKQCVIKGQNAQPILPNTLNVQQASPVVSNIPLTIIVPANFYSSSAGTTCVIPLNIPTNHTQQAAGCIVSPEENGNKPILVQSHLNNSPVLVYSKHQPLQTYISTNNSTAKKCDTNVINANNGQCKETPSHFNTQNLPWGRPITDKTLTAIGQDNKVLMKQFNVTQSGSGSLWRPW